MKSRMKFKDQNRTYNKKKKCLIIIRVKVGKKLQNKQKLQKIY